MPVSNYDGVNAIQPRNDLAGTNLTTVPKVFLECGNMRNSVDASLLFSPSFQRQLGLAISDGLATFVIHESGNAQSMTH